MGRLDRRRVFQWQFKIEGGSFALLALKPHLATLAFNRTLGNIETKSVSIDSVTDVASAIEFAENFGLVSFRDATSGVSNKAKHFSILELDVEFDGALLWCVFHGVAQQILYCHSQILLIK